MACPTIRAGRVLLRPWRGDDLPLFAAMNADSRVLEHFPATLSRVESDALADRARHHLEQHGFGPWALEVPGVADFIGFTGLVVPRFQAHFTPCVEIGWRIACDHWRNGYATEAATAALNFAFDQAWLSEVVSFTIPANHRSLRLMQRLGMQRDPAGNFDHPDLPPGHPMRPHVLYRLARHQWRTEA